MDNMRKPYKERTEIEKIQSQWGKFTALHTRGEWSSAILRAATAAELTANFAIRKEFAAQSKLAPEFVDSLLYWANGIAGKINKLLIPMSKGEVKSKIKSLGRIADEINSKRNAIIHQGEFCNEGEAKAVIHSAKTFIESLVDIYEPGFHLKQKVNVRRSK